MEVAMLTITSLCEVGRIGILKPLFLEETVYSGGVNIDKPRPGFSIALVANFDQQAGLSFGRDCHDLAFAKEYTAKPKMHHGGVIFFVIASFGAWLPHDNSRARLQIPTRVATKHLAFHDCPRSREAPLLAVHLSRRYRKRLR